MTSHSPKRHHHLVELLLYIVIVPALRIFTPPLGVYLDYHTSQTELRDDNCMRLPAPRPSLECVLLWLLDWEWVAFQVTSTRSWLQGRKPAADDRYIIFRIIPKWVGIIPLFQSFLRCMNGAGGNSMFQGVWNMLG